MLDRIGLATPPDQLIKNNWDKFFAKSGPDAKYLQFCHSGGAEHVRNALLNSPESVRQRIIVVAIAPSVIIPNKLCSRSYNYASKRDFVTRLDIGGMAKYGNELHVLEPHPDAKFWDHEFLSPTFEKHILGHINQHLKDYGGK